MKTKTFSKKGCITTQKASSNYYKGFRKAHRKGRSAELIAETLEPGKQMKAWIRQTDTTGCQ